MAFSLFHLIFVIQVRAHKFMQVDAWDLYTACVNLRQCLIWNSTYIVHVLPFYQFWNDDYYKLVKHFGIYILLLVAVIYSYACKLILLLFTVYSCIMFDIQCTCISIGIRSPSLWSLAFLSEPGWALRPIHT